MSQDNPLSILVEQIGLSPEALAKRLDIRAEYVRRALAGVPTLRIHAQVMAALGIRMRIEGGQLVLWITNEAIDALCGNDQWRKSVGLCALPHTRDQIKKLILRLRKRGMSYAKIATWMRNNCVIGPRGQHRWVEVRVSQYVAKDNPHDPEVNLSALHEWRERFRREVVSMILVRLVPDDPAFPMRWSIDAQYTDQHVILRSQRMPATLARWAIDGFAQLGWFAQHEWGAGEPVLQQQECPATPPESSANSPT